MGALLGCCPFYGLESEYQPLYSKEGMTSGADAAKIQAIADIDDELMQDPAIREAIDGDGMEDVTLDDLELEKYMKDLEPS
jgi:hypothetical protein